MTPRRNTPVTLAKISAGAARLEDRRPAEDAVIVASKLVTNAIRRSAPRSAVARAWNSPAPGGQGYPRVTDGSCDLPVLQAR